MIKLYRIYNQEQPENRFDFLDTTKHDVKELIRFYAEAITELDQDPQYDNQIEQLVLALDRNDDVMIECLLRGIGWKEQRFFGVTGHRCIYYSKDNVTYIEPPPFELPFGAIVETVVTLEGVLDFSRFTTLYWETPRFSMPCEPVFTQDKDCDWPITGYVWHGTNAVLDAYKMLAEADVNLNLNVLGFNGERDILANYAVYEVLKNVGKSWCIIKGWVETDSTAWTSRKDAKNNSVVCILYGGEIYRIHCSLLTDSMYGAVCEKLRHYYVDKRFILEKSKPLDVTLQLAMTDTPATRKRKYKFSWHTYPTDLMQGEPFGVYSALLEAGYVIDTTNLLSIYCNHYSIILLQYTDKTRFFMYNKYKHRLVEVNHGIDKNGRITLRHKK